MRALGLLGLATVSASVWYDQFRRRTEPSSVFQLVANHPKLAELDSRHRATAAHLGIAIPPALITVIGMIISWLTKPQSA